MADFPAASLMATVLVGLVADTNYLGERNEAMQKETDVVVFRRWKSCGSLIALFPEIPSDLYGRYCEAYEHIGQHGGADFHGVIQHTVPVRPEECADLAEELTRIGYHLRPIRRASWRHHEKRRQASREVATADTN
jgi:hypothetical protein